MKFEDLYKEDIFANELGITLDELNEQHALMSVVVETRHKNGGNVGHGGLIFTLADIAMAACANFLQPVSVSIQSDIRFLAAAKIGDKLTAEAIAVFGRKSMFNARVTITNQDGDLIAVAEGMYHTKRVQI
ncbi:MAG: PaaI family thioesterase [Rikenellaceae bacterium]